MKGLNTIIPNLLKVSEQTFDGFHLVHGSLVVLCRHVLIGQQSYDGLL